MIHNGRELVVPTLRYDSAQNLPDKLFKWGQILLLRNGPSDLSSNDEETQTKTTYSFPRFSVTNAYTRVSRNPGFDSGMECSQLLLKLAPEIDAAGAPNELRVTKILASGGLSHLVYDHKGGSYLARFSGPHPMHESKQASLAEFEADYAKSVRRFFGAIGLQRKIRLTPKSQGSERTA